MKATILHDLDKNRKNKVIIKTIEDALDVSLNSLIMQGYLKEEDIDKLEITIRMNHNVSGEMS